MLCPTVVGREQQLERLRKRLQRARRGDIVSRAIVSDDVFHAYSLSAGTGATLRRLASLRPSTLAVMHGSSFEGDCAQALLDLADHYDRRVLDVVEAGVAARPLWPGCPEVAVAG